MGFSYRKSVNLGPFRVNLSQSGFGYSVGSRGFRTGMEKASLPSFIKTLPQHDAAIQTLESHRDGIGAGKALNLGIEN